ncbi:hypothetical protein Acsp07_25070 [Actinomycetospora sp. NBRC 106378]|nr:hypothetical protein Acsp07_25070 [Actinomycetospora sp. NBRC 106378]
MPLPGAQVQVGDVQDPDGAGAGGEHRERRMAQDEPATFDHRRVPEPECTGGRGTQGDPTPYRRARP